MKMLNSVTEPAHEIPVRAECDVLIVGGGTAGVCAAIASARNGAKTILVEQLPLPSGTMTNGGIVANSFYSTWTEECHDPKRVVEGIAKEIMDRVIAKKGCPGGIKVDPTQNGYRRPYMFISDPEVYKATICEMLMEAFPEAQIILLTPLQTTAVSTDLVRQAGDIIEGCGHHLSLSVIRQDQGTGICAAQEKVAFRYTYDGTHTSEAGARRSGAYIARQVGTMLNM